MAKNPTVTLKSNYGTHSVTAAALDASIAKYLPASINDLRTIAEDRTGLDYSDVDTVSEFLIKFADFDHNVDDSPLRNY